MAIKQRTLIGVEDIQAVRLKCRKCYRETEHIFALDPPPMNAKPNCCQAAWVQANDPAIQLLSLLKGLWEHDGSPGFTIAFEFDEAASRHRESLRE